jgi:carbon-monoxide dehydrogenase small subunit
MLIAARDLVRRRGGLSRAAIRREMSGNLCRCTGYLGIVDAISRVMAEGVVRGRTPGATAADKAIGGGQGSDPAPNRWLGPAPGPVAVTGMEDRVELGVGPAGSDPVLPAGSGAVPPRRGREPVRVATGSVEEAGGGVRLSQSFVLEHPRGAVWALMSDPEAVARCMPGAGLDGPPQDGRIAGRIEVRLGPIVARFAGTGTVTQVPDDYRQVIEGHGADRRSGSRVAGSVDYRLSAVAGASGGEATRVDVAIGYALTGMLAQIGRSGVARDLAQRIGEAFAQNIDARLGAPAGAAAPPTQLGALAVLLAALRARVRAFLARIRGA